MFRGKKYQESAKLIDKAALYDTAEAMELVVKTAPAKFDETVELHVKLGVDSRHADQQVRGAIVLPHGTGKTQRVLVFAKADKADEAKAAGADFVGEMDLVEKIQKENWFDFDVVVATPDMMGVVGRLGKVLGPKGLMPSPKAGTVTLDVTKAVNEIKAGKVEYRLDKTNIIHCPIGKVSFGAEKLTENFNALMGAIVKAKPAAAKGQYIRSCVCASTMGPGVKINSAKLMYHLTAFRRGFPGTAGEAIAPVGITRKKGTDVPLRRKRRIRAGRPRKKMSFSDRLCLTQPVRDDILLTVFKDSRWAQAGNPAENAATTG